MLASITLLMGIALLAINYWAGSTVGQEGAAGQQWREKQEQVAKRNQVWLAQFKLKPLMNLL